KEGEKVEVPKDKYVVFGDNRENSSDSRQWGFVEKRDFVGRSVIRYWPPQSFGIMTNPGTK
ncbi:signal peptidase I, partial [bacterium]|nr:signal peptidase I [bacterium]